MSRRRDDPFGDRPEEGDLARYAVSRVNRIFGEREIDHVDHYLLMMGILRARQALSSRLSKALRRFELSYSEYLLLMTLEIRGRDRPLLVSRLAERMLVHPTTVTLRAEKLEKRGLLERSQHPTDQRASLAKLTNDGAKLLDEINQSLASGKFGMSEISDTAARTALEQMIPFLVPTKE